MNSCKWALTSYCSTNPAFRKCVPKWVCDCAGDTNCYNCNRFCWASCPSWSEWIPMESPYLWSISPEFRLRRCPCDQETLEPLGSRIFQSDRVSGHCVQTRLPTGISAFPWHSFYFCLALLVFLIVYLVRDCSAEKRKRRTFPADNFEEDMKSKKDRRELDV